MKMFSSITNTNTSCTITSLNNNMSPFPQYYFPSSSSPNYHLSPQPQPQPQPQQGPPQAQLPLSSSSSLVLINQEHDNIFLPQNHTPYDPTLLLAHTTHAQPIPETLINLGVSNCSALIGSAGPGAPIGPAPKKATAPKKDRHSKIYTAQGLRDRRVRLSIEIAREFFDLHDMLGFDKASKTLEWLLGKSRKAIRELSTAADHHDVVPRGGGGGGSKASVWSCADSECEQAVSEANELGHSAAIDADEVEESDQALASKSNCIGPDEASLAAKESRAKARARARERTKEKRFKCNASHHGKNVMIEKCGSSSQISAQFRSLMSSVHHHGQPIPVFSAASNYQGTSRPLRLADDDDDQCHNVEVKRKYLKFPNLISSSTNYDGRDRDQQRESFAIALKGESSNSNNNNNNNAIYSSSSSSSLLLPANWDINCTALSPRPSFRVPT